MKIKTSVKKIWTIFPVYFLCALCLLFLSANHADAAERLRVGVLRFESKADSVSQRQAEIITDLFTRELANSKAIQVFERTQMEAIGAEVRFGMSGLVDMNTAVEVGKIAGLQYMLMGAVTELSQKASGGAFAGIGGVTHTARATIDMRVVNVATSEVVLALSAEGTSKNSGSALSIGGFTFAEAEFDGIEARAIADAVSVLGHKLRDAMAGESSHIIAITNDGYAIDVQAKEGALYLVYADGKAILDMNGNMIDREKIPFAVLKVRDSNSGHSVATLTQGCKGDQIRRGDKIEPISPAKAKQLLEGKKFASNRPSASSGTFDQIFGGGGAPAAAPTPTATPAPAVDEAPVTPATPAAPTPVRPAITPAAPAKEIAGFDPNTSSDAKVIETYPIDSKLINNIGIMQRASYNQYRNGKNQAAYDGFVRAFEAYDGNYLSAYWAGMASLKLKKKDEAAQWFDRALAINPNYKPAQDAKGKL